MPDASSLDRLAGSTTAARRFVLAGLFVVLLLVPVPLVEGHTWTTDWYEHSIKTRIDNWIGGAETWTAPGDGSVRRMATISQEVPARSDNVDDNIDDLVGHDGWWHQGGILVEFQTYDDTVHLGLTMEWQEPTGGAIAGSGLPLTVCNDLDGDGVYCETDSEDGPVEFARSGCLDRYWSLHLPAIGEPVAIFAGVRPERVDWWSMCGDSWPDNDPMLWITTRDAGPRPVEGVAVAEGSGYVGDRVNETIEERRSEACNENGLTAGERCDVWTIVQDLWSCGYPLEELPEDARKLVEQLLGEAPEIVQNVVDEARDQAHDAKCKARDTVEEVT